MWAQQQERVEMTSTLAAVFPQHPITGVTAIGFSSEDEPIWPVFGGAEDDDTDDDADDDADEEEEDDEDDADTDWKKRAKDAEERARKANYEAGARRKLLKKHGIDPRTGEKRTSVEDEDDTDDDEIDTTKKKTGEGISEKDVKVRVKKAVNAAVADTKLELQPVLHALARRVALDDSGVLPEWRELLSEKLDVEELDVDDEGNITGLDEQLTDLKRRFPKCFAKKGQRVGSGRETGGARDLDGGKKGTGTNNKKTWDQQMDDMMTGAS